MIDLYRGMVLAAGLGLRMRPLTQDTAKPLLTLAGRALLDHALDRLEEAGVRDAVVNAHWHADKVAATVAARASPRIHLQREDDLLETGGGRSCLVQKRTIGPGAPHEVERDPLGEALRRADQDVANRKRGRGPALAHGVAGGDDRRIHQSNNLPRPRSRARWSSWAAGRRPSSSSARSRPSRSTSCGPPAASPSGRWATSPPRWAAT